MRKISKSRIIEKIKRHFSEDSQTEQIYNFYESWLTIDHKTVKQNKNNFINLFLLTYINL
jgi:hypothetical protein